MSKLSAASPAVAPRYLPFQLYYAALDTWRGRRAAELRSSILVAGAPRSGTTWLGDVVAALAGWPLLHEPTHTHKVPELRDGHGWDGRPFREPLEADPELAADLEQLLTGRYLGPGLVPRSRAMDAALWARRPMVSKVIDVNLMLPWMAHHLPWLRTVHVVRHPLAVVASQEARTESIWSGMREIGPPYEHFIAAHPEYAVPTSYETVAETLVTIWALEHAWLRDRADDLTGLIQLRYEDLRADLAAEAPRLAARLDLPAPSDELVSQLDRPSRTVNRTASTLGKDAASGWRERYRGEQLDRLRAILERFDHPFYGPEAL
ncbi:MAG: sulfotransferase [Actinobacteria bacterium]|nr:sulfotransferase [Actinomycetota bacterium]